MIAIVKKMHCNDFKRLFLGIFIRALFIPVEHRSYNRVFKISSTFLIPPSPETSPKTSTRMQKWGA